MKKLDIYIDGSHLEKQKKLNGRLGCGGVIVDPDGGGTMGKLVNKFSIQLLPEFMKMSFGATECSNPSAELTALLMALKNFKGDIKDFGPDTMIVIHADYIGVREWMTGAWKIKEPYIARIKGDIDQEIRKQGLVNRVKYEWIKGHQIDNTKPEVYWNNYVDKLAKGEEN